MILPGLASLACFGTVVLRLRGKANVWSGCASLVLVVLWPFFWFVGFMIVLIVVLVIQSWYLVLGILAFVVAFTLALEMLARYLERRSDG